MTDDDEESGFDVDGLFTGPLAGKVYERDGLTTQDMSGMDIPPELMEKFVDALIAAGQAVRDEDGQLSLIQDHRGETMAVDFKVDDDGNVYDVEIHSGPDIEAELRKVQN